MAKDYRRKWSEDRFPITWIRSIRAFFDRIRFWMSWPLRALTAEKSSFKDAKPGFLRRLSYPFLWFFALVLYSIANAGDLVVGWSKTRESKALIYGLPAMLSFALFVFILAYLYNTKRGGLINNYLLKATNAERVEHFETARMYYQKLLQLDDTNQSYEFLIARSFDSEGNIDEASRRMFKLRKEPDIRGLVNFWFAKKTLENEGLDEKQKLQSCRGYLSVFLEGAPNHYEANSLAVEVNSKLAEYFFLRSDLVSSIRALKKAETHAENLANIDPRSILALARIQLRMAQLYEKIGDAGAVNRMQALSSATAETSVNHYAANLKAKPDSLEDLLRLSDSYLFQKKYELAIRPLDIAITNDLQKRITPQLTEFKSKIYAAWSGELLRVGTSNLSTCVELVDKAIQLNPKNQAALAILAQISIMNNDEVKLVAKQRLEGALGNAVAPFSVHVILGSHAAMNKEDELAIKHLRQALLMNRRATAVMNNLAFVLARQQEPRFEEALALINNALKLVPRNPRFLDTRGNIYMQMKQYELAFHDLESAEMQMKDSVALYENLLFLVQELGFEDLYRRKYEKGLNRLKAPATTVSPK